MSERLRFARPSVLDAIPAERHTVIEASAGTGKTFTLEHLVVERLVRGARLEEVLVVTFTEKATREMRARVRATLDAIVHPRAGDPRVNPAEGPAWELDAGARTRLLEALVGFDRAPISTIHGFCQRVLVENAFQSQRPFRQVLVEPRRAFGRAFRDTLRAILAPRAAGALREVVLRVLEDMDAPRLEAALFPWYLERGAPRPSWDRARFAAAMDGLWTPAEQPALAERVRQAIGRRDLAARVVKQLGLLARIAERWRANRDPLEAILAVDGWGRAEVVKDEPARAWLPSRLKGKEALGAERAALEALLAVATSPFGVLVHELVPRVRARLDAEKARLGEVDFDDMLRLVHEALEGPGGEALAATLRSQYRFALVDEFQDTDELQWAIFRRLFVESRAGHVLYVIGDPKQAIYGFRNADVHTYRQARERLMGGAAPVRLGRNFRSTARVIDAYNAVFAEGFFQGDIRYDEPVACGDPSRRAIGPGGEDAPAMTLWTVAGAEKPSAAELRATLGDRIAREVKALVEGEPAPLRIVEKGRARRVGYADVFVLTRNAREAEAIAEALARHGVPHAFYKQDGLFDTQEARDVLDVLRAVADPSDRSARLRAWLTPFFAVPLSSLAACRDLDPQHPLVARLFRLRQLAERHDGAGLLRALVEESGLVRRLLFLDSTGRGRESASGDGERALTNIQHVIEVLLEESGGRRGVDELVARLEAFVEGRAEPMSGEGAVQRLESDRPAVQLLTMHKSKGLEAGVVFLAGGFTKGGGGDRHEPLIAHEDGQREAWLRPVPDEVEERVAREAREEDERLLYVALTRAKARLYVPYLGPPPPGAEGALAGLERYGPLRGPLRWLDERLAALVRGGFVDGDAVTWERVEVRPPEPRDVAADRAALEALEVREARGGARWDALREAHAGYVLTSYTRMKSREGGYVAPPLEGEGGAGEEFTGEVAEPAPGAALALEEELDALPGGAGMGVFLHGVLEDLDPAEVKTVADADAWAARPRVARLFEARARTSGVDAAHLPAAARLIHRALRAPQRFGGVHLEGGFCELEERVAEMSFHYPIPERAHPPLEAPRPASEQGEARPFAIERGVIRGVVDLVFERAGRTFFLDWKSDRLPRWDPAALGAHVQANYALQAKLYTLGIVRLLDVRDEAAYEARFGGLLYCFLRAMGRGEEGSGVVFERPAWEDVRAWERELRESRTPFGYVIDPRGARPGRGVTGAGA